MSASAQIVLIAAVGLLGLGACALLCLAVMAMADLMELPK